MKKSKKNNKLKNERTEKEKYNGLQSFVNRSFEENGQNKIPILNPIFDFDELKNHREKLYKNEWSEQVKSDLKNEVKTDESTKKIHRKRWLSNELKLCDKWILGQESSKFGKESTIVQIEKYRLYVNQELEKSNKKVELNSQQITYKWHGNFEEETTVLYNHLLDMCISKETTLPEFKQVFSGVALEKVQPIKWIANKNLLAYFIDSLYSKNKLRFTINPEKWKIAKNCFTNASNLSQSNDLYKNNKIGLPKDHKLIDDILINLI